MTNLKDMNELITKSAIAFGIAFTPVVKKAAAAMTEFGEAIYKVAEKEYLKHHQRLPGGTSSPRLRKKRRTLVMRWFFKEYRPLKGV